MTRYELNFNFYYATNFLDLIKFELLSFKIKWKYLLDF